MLKLHASISKKGGDLTFMFVLKKKKGETDDKLIARFRKKTIVEGVMQEYRDLEHYTKPAEKRKEAKYRIAHSIELEKKRSY
jgi:ribosomal protein S21